MKARRRSARSMRKSAGTNASTFRSCRCATASSSPANDSASYRSMRVICIGGGPAGLYFGLLVKQRFPPWAVQVLERNRPDDTFGWGVVFSDATLDALRKADEPTHRAITQAFAHWDDIDVHFEGHTITSSGHGFSG